MATPNGLARIDTNGGAAKKKHENGICHDDSSAPVRAQNIDELHSMQRKRSAPTTPIKQADGAAVSPFAAAISEEGRRTQQLQSIRFVHPSILPRLLPSNFGFAGTSDRGHWGIMK
jgi:phosphoenolpyruvate carboxykinase (ATP)